MSYRLSEVSEARLKAAQVDLARTIRRAIELTQQDFTVFEVARTMERQQELVAAGASRTLNSYHLPDAHGVSHAADLVPYVAGQLQWQSEPCYAVARAMHRAAQHTSARITWGGVWDRLLTTLDVADLAGEVERYSVRHRAAHDGKRPLVDLPHFQIAR